MPEANSAGSNVLSTARVGRYSRHVGRVGALAVALGVGAAIATTPGVAWAGPETDTTNKADTAGPAPTPSVNGSVDSTPGTASVATPSPPETPSKSSATVTVGDATSPKTSVATSGGANATINGVPTDTTDGESSNESSIGETTEEAGEDDEASSEVDRVAPAEAKSSVGLLPKLKTDNTPSQAATTPPDPFTAVAAAVVNLTQAVIGLAVPSPATSAPVVAPAISARAVAVTEPATTAIEPDTAPAPAPAPGFIGAVTRVVVSVLAPFFTPGPEAPPAPTFIWTVLAWIRREVDTTVTRLGTAPTDETLTSESIAPMALARTAAPTTLAAAATPAPPPPSGLLPTVSFVAAGVGNIVGGILGFLGTVIGGVFNSAPAASPTFTNIDPITAAVTGKLNATDADGDAMTYAVTTQAPKGTATVDAAGTFVYTPTPAARAAALATPGPDVDTFTITITDARGATTAVTINNAPITPANRAPSGGSYSTGTTNTGDGAVPVTITATDSDGDQLTYSAPTTTASGGTITKTGINTFTYTPEPSDRHPASVPGAPTAVTQDSFTVTVTDGRGGTTTVPVTVTISPTNEKPTGTYTVGQPTVSNGAVTVTIAGSDPDGDTLVYSGPSGQTALGGIVTKSGVNTFTYTPSTQARSDANGTVGPDLDSFAITISDGHGGTTAVPVTVTVDPANQAPVGGSYTTGTTNTGDGAVPVIITATDPDGDQLTYSAPTTTASGGTIAKTGINTFTYTPEPSDRHPASVPGAPAAVTQDSFTVTVTDGRGGTTTVLVTVAVSPSNVVPTNVGTTNVQPNYNSGVVTGKITAFDGDNDTLTYSAPETTPKGKVAVNADGTFTYTAKEQTRIDAGMNPNGATDAFSVTVNDGHGGVVTKQVSVDIPGIFFFHNISMPIVVDPATGDTYQSDEYTSSGDGRYSRTAITITRRDGTVSTTQYVPGRAALKLTFDPASGTVYQPIGRYDPAIGDNTFSLVAFRPDGTVTSYAMPGSIAQGVEFNRVTGAVYQRTSDFNRGSELTVIDSHGAISTISPPGRIDNLVVNPVTGVATITTINYIETQRRYANVVYTLNPNGTVVASPATQNSTQITVDPSTGTTYTIVGVLDGSNRYDYALTVTQTDGATHTRPLTGDAFRVEVDPRTGIGYVRTTIYDAANRNLITSSTFSKINSDGTLATLVTNSSGALTAYVNPVNGSVSYTTSVFNPNPFRYEMHSLYGLNADGTSTLIASDPTTVIDGPAYNTATGAAYYSVQKYSTELNGYVDDSVLLVRADRSTARISLPKRSAEGDDLRRVSDIVVNPVNGNAYIVLKPTRTYNGNVEPTTVLTIHPDGTSATSTIIGYAIGNPVVNPVTGSATQSTGPRNYVIDPASR